jgi:enoyl-[acyl-carrier protein] reductase I
MSIPVAKAPLLEGKRGLIVGIANDQSIAWGCARAFRALGAEVAVTYLNEKAKRFVEPLAKELEAPIFMPLDVSVEGQTEAVFEEIEKQWGEMDYMIHSIAFSPKGALHGRVSMWSGTASSPPWTCRAGRSSRTPCRRYGRRARPG